MSLSCSIDLAVQESAGAGDSRDVGQVRSIDDERSLADRITSVADRQSIVGRVTRDDTVLLSVASVAVQNHSDNPVLDGGPEVSDSTDHDSCALRVAAPNDDSIGTLAGSQTEESLSLADCSGRCALR